jgi:signal peptidase I
MAANPEKDPHGITESLVENWPWVLVCVLLTLRFLVLEFNPLIAAAILAAGIALLATQAYMTRKPMSEGGFAQGAVKVRKFTEAGWLYIIIVAFFALYMLFKNPLFGVVVGLGIIGLVISEVITGLFTGGLKKEIRETIVSLFIALFVWYGAAFLLGTPAPVNGIVSCSMLPQLERGDFTILQGGAVNTATISMSRAEFDSIGASALVSYNDTTFTVNGSMFSYCAQNNDSICRDFVYFPAQFSETKGPLKFQYASCERYYPKTGATASQPCVSYVEYKGQRIYENLSNDVVVYQPGANDLNRRVGDIIHRAYLRIDAGGGSYYLIKGDNNPIFDIQNYAYSLKEGNAPVSEQQLKGKVIFRVPILGYAKLFISGMYVEPEGCDSYYLKYKR